MKRDMDLMRKMLLAVEASPFGYAPQPLTIEGYTADQIGYHAYLLIDAGLASGSDMTNTASTGPTSRIIKLTWEGHEFLDASRTPMIWEEVWGQMKEHGLASTSTKLLLKMLDKVARKKLGDP
jgi:hypothetical protein